MSESNASVVAGFVGWGAGFLTAGSIAAMFFMNYMNRSFADLLPPEGVFWIGLIVSAFVGLGVGLITGGVTYFICIRQTEFDFSPPEPPKKK